MEGKIAIELTMQILKSVAKGIKGFTKGCFKVAKYTAKGGYQVGKSTTKATSRVLDGYNRMLDNTYKKVKEKQINNTEPYSRRSSKSYENPGSNNDRIKSNSNDMDLF